MTANDHYYDADMARNQARVASTPDMAAQRWQMLECLELRPGEMVLDARSADGRLRVRVQFRHLNGAIRDGRPQVDYTDFHLLIADRDAH